MSEPTPEAVEAAVNAQGRSTNPKWDHPIFGYETFSDDQKKWLRESARIALSAAAPYLIREAQAQALEDAAKDFDLSTTADICNTAGVPRPTQQVSDFLTAVLWLKARAAAIRDGAA